MTEELETKEKLKLMKIAKEWLRTEHSESNIQSLVNLILSFTEPREKQIEIDAEQIRALQKQNGELTDRVKELEVQNLQLLKEWRVMDKVKQKAELKVAELMGDVSTLEQDYKRLEAQIEKMKCCGNCKHCKYDQNEKSNEYCEKHQQIINVAIRPCIEWELAE